MILDVARLVAQHCDVPGTIARDLRTAYLRTTSPTFLIFAPHQEHPLFVVKVEEQSALERDHARAARLYELLPNATGVLLVEFALRAGYAPVLIGSLGFLGFGVRPPTPEWGLMISENRALLIVSPITVLGPGLALASLVVGLNLFTEGLARILGRTVRLGER